MNNIGDEPAYPVLIDGVQYPGLNKREKIAALIMQGMYAATQMNTLGRSADGKMNWPCEELCYTCALSQADAFLAESSREVKHD